MISVRTERKTKESAQKLAREIGIPLGTLINAYLKSLAREERVSFGIAQYPSKQTQLLLSGVRKERVGKDRLKNESDLRRSLNLLKHG